MLLRGTFGKIRKKIRGKWFVVWLLTRSSKTKVSLTEMHVCGMASHTCALLSVGCIEFRAPRRKHMRGNNRGENRASWQGREARGERIICQHILFIYWITVSKFIIILLIRHLITIYILFWIGMYIFFFDEITMYILISNFDSGPYF